MTPKEAITKFESKNPDRKVRDVRVLKDGFFITAPLKDIKGVDYSDPFFLMSSKTGEIEGFSPIENMEMFHKIMKAKPTSVETI